MAMRIFPNGTGQNTGDTLATTKPLYTSGDIWYVNSNGGVDAGSPAGQDAQRPLATISQAYTNAAAGDVIVLMDGHTQTVTTALAIAKQLYIVGGGSAGGIPTVNFTMNAGNQDIFDITAANTEIRNIRFKEPAQNCVGGTYGAKVGIGASGVRVIGCYFDMGPKDTGEYGIFVALNSNNVRIANTTLISTATSGTRPFGAIGGSGGGTMTDMELDGLVLSDGTNGYQNPAFNMSASTLTRLRATNLSLLLGAEFIMGTLSGFVAAPTTTGGARVIG